MPNTSTALSNPIGKFPSSDKIDEQDSPVFQYLDLRMKSVGKFPGLNLQQNIVTSENAVVNGPSPSTTIAVETNNALSAPIPTVRNYNPNDVETFSPLQEWEGYVTEITETSFVAHLIDRTAGKTIPEELMEFAIEELSDDNKELLQEGAIFRWSIGYHKFHGTKRKASDIVFRRLPAFTKKDLVAAEARATRLSEALTWD